MTLVEAVSLATLALSILSFAVAVALFLSFQDRGRWWWMLPLSLGTGLFRRGLELWAAGQSDPPAWIATIDPLFRLAASMLFLAGLWSAFRTVQAGNRETIELTRRLREAEARHDV